MCIYEVSRQWRRSGVFIVNFEHISHPFYSVYIADFHQVNVSWCTRPIHPQWTLLQFTNQANKKNSSISGLIMKYMKCGMLFCAIFKLFTGGILQIFQSFSTTSLISLWNHLTYIWGSTLTSILNPYRDVSRTQSIIFDGALLRK